MYSANISTKNENLYFENLKWVDIEYINGSNIIGSII